MENIKNILEQQLENITPSAQETFEIKSKTKDLVDALTKNLKKNKIQAEVFVGGSSAKNTLIKKRKYDIDIFVRFDKKYPEKQLSDLLKKCLPSEAVRKKGSRDYFSIKRSSDNMEFEIVPVIKISSPAEAQNITDLSYFHVSYVSNHIKRVPRLADEIRITKAFAYYQECYGAESYINGFSGYATELIVIHYKTFLNFIKAIAKANLKEKIVIDTAKHYKNKDAIITEMNPSKLFSPIILVDPTFKERNALAALSLKTFEKFQKSCKAFLKNPSQKFFESEDKEEAMIEKYKDNLIRIEVTTDKQAGDIGGTKLKKFYNYFLTEFEKLFDIEKTDFEYDENRNAGIMMLVAKPKKQIIFSGPPISMKQALAGFKKSHKKIQIRAGKAYATEKNTITLPKFLKDFIKSKKRIIKEMGVELKA